MVIQNTFLMETSAMQLASVTHKRQEMYPAMTIGNVEEHSAVTISQIPDTVMIKVFSYLSTNEIMEVIPQVNTRWKLLATEEHVWWQVELTNNAISTSRALNLLITLPRLKSLVLYKRHDTNEILKCICDYNNHLENLVLTICNCYKCLGSVSENTLCRVLEHLSNLRSLTIENGRILCGQFRCSLGKSLPNLKEVSLSGYVWHITSVPLEFHENCRLEKFKYFASSLSDSNCTAIAEKFKNTLKSLELHAAFLRDESMIAVGECQNLEKLHLLGAHQISDFGLSQIGNLRELRELIISETFRTSPEGWIEMFKVSRLNNLRSLELQLQCFELTDQALLTCALSCPNLERVILAQHFRVSTFGVCRMFQCGKRIQCLDYKIGPDIIKLRSLMGNESKRQECSYQPSYFLRKEPIMALKVNQNFESSSCLQTVSSSFGAMVTLLYILPAKYFNIL